MRLRQLRIGLQRLVRPVDRSAVEAIRADERQAQQSLRVLRLAHESFLEQVLRVLVVEPLVQHSTPTHAIQRVAVRLSDGRAEVLVGALVIMQTPVPLGLQVRRRGARQALITGLCSGTVAVLLQLLTALELCRGSGRNPPHAEDAQHDEQWQSGPAHLSSSSWTLASATSAWVSCCRYSAGDMAARWYFSVSI